MRFPAGNSSSGAAGAPAAPLQLPPTPLRLGAGGRGRGKTPQPFRSLSPCPSFALQDTRLAACPSAGCNPVPPAGRFPVHGLGEGFDFPSLAFYRGEGDRNMDFKTVEAALEMLTMLISTACKPGALLNPYQKGGIQQRVLLKSHFLSPLDTPRRQGYFTS